ncbi:NAD-dependent succinate-semialdehyde dehydrogenase [Noviherbaspirillum saxi]|uniref:NAD-dependent succinate-semialdehyde dehydrogenase n=1 Tax=Noviherbaspirillum saxi TaxID=2320863 RepID=A0A3A3GG42_9BURK|nr:NAD-dependent succinate-semialdehyde dehydrogenase [Noviherbaspirillum saxi]RJF99879.1 NAD-dependent succinate-semialdehyde dehydrogenase [Noviherbaspirillum saxi]
MTSDIDIPRQLIGGNWVQGNGVARNLLNPADGRPLREYGGASARQIEQALDAAQAAFPLWRATPAVERSRMLRKAAVLLQARRDELAPVLTLEQGKPLSEARTEWANAIEVLEWYADEGLRAYGRVIPARQANTRQLVVREPIGPVAAFAPWNFPALTPMRKIAGALAAGCSCIIKPAEETPLSTLAIAQALIDAGLPAGVLNVVFGDAPAIAQQLIESPIIRKMSFTGSTAVGKLLAAQAAALAKPATLELGGHAPVLIFADADLDRAVALAGSAKFRNSGQICVAPTRFIVHASVYDAFVERLTRFASSLRIGPGLDSATELGPLANARRIAHAEALTADARAKGARIACGGERLNRDGYYWPATVLSDVPPDTNILQEESFSPLAPCVRFNSFDEAMQIANGVPYGLATYAFTQSLGTAHRVADALEAGMVGINTCRLSLAELPFGGVKDSGYGTEGGTEGLAAYLTTKSISLAHD